MGILVKLYLLELEHGKFYVGQTDDIDIRYNDHALGFGAKWTRLHPVVKILKTKEIEVENTKIALLFENWMTLHFMEKYGWQHVRGGDYSVLEEYQLKEKITHIFDTESNSIRYYIQAQQHYLFGATDHWIIYVLALENNKYYIGSAKRLGKKLGAHFQGTSIEWTKINRPLYVAEIRVVKPGEGNYVDIKHQLLSEYRQKFGNDNVIGGNAQKE